MAKDDTIVAYSLHIVKCAKGFMFAGLPRPYGVDKAAWTR